MPKHDLPDHVFGTYVSLRYGLAAIGAALPIVVYLIGVANGVKLQSSMSAYYWATRAGNAPSRDWFVGCLFAVAAGLYLYKGFTTAENVVLNLAGIFAVGVAVIPMQWECKIDCDRFSLHGASAILLFLCLVYVVRFRAGDTLKLLPEAQRARYKKVYVVIGLVMLASPLTAFVLNVLVAGGTSYVFWIEALGIWAFAAYWLVKSRELKHSSATTRAVRGAVKATSTGEVVPTTPDEQAPVALSA
jgi:hypothetical protein